MMKLKIFSLAVLSLILLVLISGCTLKSNTEEGDEVMMQDIYVNDSMMQDDGVVNDDVMMDDNDSGEVDIDAEIKALDQEIDSASDSDFDPDKLPEDYLEL